MSLLKKTVMVFVLADNFLTNLIKNLLFRPKYRLTGKCLKCGSCCRRILLKGTPSQLNSPLFRFVAIKWIEWLFEFRFIEVDEESCCLVFFCSNQNADGTCGNYFWRPNICRNYPLIDHFKEPVFLPDCGFNFKNCDNIFTVLTKRKGN